VCVSLSGLQQLNEMTESLPGEFLLRHLLSIGLCVSDLRGATHAWEPHPNLAYKQACCNGKALSDNISLHESCDS
jgi:hypothetical protein